MRHSLLAAVTTSLALAACSGGGGGPNPETLWLALDGTETQVRLVGSEPTPF
jgi:hypothetical protein